VSKYLKDAAERLSWTLLYAMIAWGVTEATNSSDKYAPLILVLLQVIKLAVAKFVGNPNTAAIGGDSVEATTAVLAEGPTDVPEGTLDS